MFMATQNPRWHLKTCMNLTSLGFWHQGRTNYLDGPSDDHPPPSSQMATHTRSLQTSHSDQSDIKSDIFLWGKKSHLPSSAVFFLRKKNHLPSSAVLWSKASQGWAKTALAVSLLVGISTSNLEQGCWFQGICENSLFDKFLRAVGHHIKCWVIEAVLASGLNKLNSLWSWSFIWIAISIVSISTLMKDLVLTTLLCVEMSVPAQNGLIPPETNIIRTTWVS